MAVVSLHISKYLFTCKAWHVQESLLLRAVLSLENCSALWQKEVRC